MKALVAQELSGPSGLVYTDVDDVADGGDAVVIDVAAAGVCFPDLLLTRGEYQLKMEPPFIPGMEVAGVVRSAPAFSGFKPGQRVSAMTGLGGFAERVAVPVANVTRSPDELDDREAVSLLVNYYTMYFALARRASMRRAAPGRRLGAGRRDHTDGDGVDLVVDPVGGEAFDDAVRVLATEGRILVIGFAAGGIPTVKVNRLLLRNVGVLGVGWGEFMSRNPNAQSLFGWGLGQLVFLGLKPPPPVRYPLSEGREALQRMADGGVYGKLVLEP